VYWLPFQILCKHGVVGLCGDLRENGIFKIDKVFLVANNSFFEKSGQRCTENERKTCFSEQKYVALIVLRYMLHLPMLKKCLKIVQNKSNI